MPSSRMTALLGLLAVAGYQNRHKLGELIGKAAGQGGSAGAQSGGGLLEGILGGVSIGGGRGGMLGGATGASSSQGGLLAGGLRELVDRFTNSGQADVAKSWVDTGPHRSIDAQQLESALGQDTIENLTRETGLTREELLSRLQTVLPTAVDKLTPEGRLPSEQ